MARAHLQSPRRLDKVLILSALTQTLQFGSPAISALPLAKRTYVGKGESRRGGT